MGQLHQLSTRLTAKTDLLSILQEVLDATMELQAADMGDVQLFEEATRTLRIVAHRGVDKAFLDYFATVDASDTSACGLALRDGTRIVIEDVNTCAEYAPHRAIAAATGYRGVQSTPLLERQTGRPLGMLSTLFRKPHRPSVLELRLTDLYARQATDVIAFRLAEHRLRESEAKLQAAVELAKLGRYSWNPLTNELEWDDVLRAMWGLPAGVHVDHEIWASAVHPDDMPRVKAAVERCIDPDGDGVYDVEYRVRGVSDGVERWIATRGRTQFENRMPARFYGVAVDVTERKQVERALERRVEERTRELAEVNHKLRTQIEQREIAEATVRELQRIEAIGQITSGIAHDFNNLLSVILTNARLLARSLSDDDDREGVDLIHAAAEKGAKLVTQLLAFSRRQRLEPQSVDLNAEIIGMRHLIVAALGGHIRLETALADNLWRAVADPTQIELTVLNLAINARDAMPAGGTIRITTSNEVVEQSSPRLEEPPPGQYVALQVADTGTGIADDVLPRVFEPFFTTKEPGKGSGLGLAQVFGFAKQSGGGVEIRTHVGDGTSLKVYLPRETVLRGREREPRSEGKGYEVPGQPKVLVVDDDQSVLKSTARMLQTLGFAALPAASGKSALQVIADNPSIAVVLADFAMPEMNGAALARAVRAARPDLPVILVSGHGHLELASEFGEARILQKPFTETELLARIMNALR